MKKSPCNGFVILDFAFSFLILILILAAYLQFQENSLGDSGEYSSNHSTLRKVSDAASYLVQWGLAEEHGTYYETHVVSGERISSLQVTQNFLRERLSLNSIEIALGGPPQSPPARQNKFCVTRLVLYKNTPAALGVCGD